MLVVLRQRNFACLLTAGFISGLGDVVLAIALPFYVYGVTGSTLASGSKMIAGTIPRVLFGSVAGVFVDRWDRRRTMIAADCARAAILLPLLTTGFGGPLWLVYLVAFPQLALLGLPSVVLADSVSFLASALLLGLISVAPRPRELVRADLASRVPVDRIGRLARVWHEWREGLRLIRSDRVLGATLIVFGAIGFGDGVANVLYVPFMRDVLHGGPLEWGELATASSAAGLAGAFVIGFLGRRVRPMGLIVLGVWAAAAYILVMTHLPVIGAIIVMAVLTTPLVMGINIGGGALIQGRTPDVFRGRVFSTITATTGVTMLCGMGLSSGIGTVVELVPILNAAAGLYVLSGIVALTVLRVRVPTMEKPLAEAG